MPITRIPLRLQILRALTDVIKQVNPTNLIVPGDPSSRYEFDLRDDTSTVPSRPRVTRGRLHIGEDEPLPMVTIVEPPMAIEGMSTQRQPDNTAHAGQWDMIIQGWAKGDPWYPSDVGYQLMQEVRCALAKEKKRGRNGNTNILGFDSTKIQNMTIGSPVIRPNEHISEQAVFYFVLTFTICEDTASPLG